MKNMLALRFKNTIAFCHTMQTNWAKNGFIISWHVFFSYTTIGMLMPFSKSLDVVERQSFAYKYLIKCLETLLVGSAFLKFNVVMGLCWWWLCSRPLPWEQFRNEIHYCFFRTLQLVENANVETDVERKSQYQEKYHETHCASYYNESFAQSPVFRVGGCDATIWHDAALLTEKTEILQSQQMPTEQITNLFRAERFVIWLHAHSVRSSIVVGLWQWFCAFLRIG
jgi:hypothetical protein